MFKDEESVKFLEDPTVKSKFSSAKKLADVSADSYDAIFYVGGHGPVIDLASDPVNAKLASAFFQAGKVTAAVCHGPAALVGATDRVVDRESRLGVRQGGCQKQSAERALRRQSLLPNT